MIRLLIALAACAGTAPVPLPRAPTPPAVTAVAPPPAPVVQRSAITVAVGATHSCALLEDRKVACWGSDSDGQLGDGHAGERRHRASLVTIDGAPIDNVVQILAGGHRSCAVRSDGELLCWGTSFGATPSTVGWSDVVEATLGEQLCAVTIAGEARCAAFGPDGLEEPAETTAGLDGVVEIAAGAHGCARRVDGTVRCWGEGRFGERGDGRYMVARGVTMVRNLDDAVDLAAGAHHGCVVSSDGTVACWGHTRYGQVGDGRSGRGPVHGVRAASSPLTVEGLDDVVQIAAGGDVSCGRTNAGTISCWGRNAHGQVGVAVRTSGIRGAVIPHVPRPNDVGVEGATDVAVGPEHACAVVEDGRVSCWGLNLDGQLGVEPVTQRARPVQVSGITAAGLALGAGYSCARTVDGAVQCWGGFAPKFDPDLSGNRSFEPVTGRPRQVAGIGDATALALGFSHGCARQEGGRVSCWGRNEAAQIVPRRWSALSFRATRVPIRDVDGIAAGGFHTCATDRLGKVRCWGGIHGAVTGNRLTRRPTLVDGIGEVNLVAAGRRHTCVLEKSGRVACWGDNFYGAVGHTDGDVSERPNDIEGIVGTVTDLAVGEHHSCALVESGDVYCWGAFARRPIRGAMRAIASPAPIRINGLTSAIEIGCGASHTCARRRDGRIACFGDNRHGQLGDGTSDYRSEPVEVIGVRGADELAVGDTHSCVRDDAGNVFCWGDNRRAELGDGTVPYTHVPVEASL